MLDTHLSSENKPVFNGFNLFYSWLEMIILIIFFAIQISIDQVTKIFAERHLMLWQDLNNLKSYQGTAHVLWQHGEELSDKGIWTYFGFNYVRNQGAAWGFLSQAPDFYRVPFFYFVSAIAIFFIFSYIRSTVQKDYLQRWALYLILSGAIGNLIDRVRLGYVIDFLDVRWRFPLPMVGNWVYYFPNFNWADSSISVGVFLLVIKMIFFEESTKPNMVALHSH